MVYKKTTVCIEKEIHAKMKLYCVKNNISVKDFINQLIKEKIKEK